METNWNQLIELYLQNELSEEGKNAFEQELNINPELREELEMHQLVRSAAKRAAQRNIVRQAGQTYLRNLRIKQFTVGVVVTAVSVVGIVYWTHSKNETNNNKSERAILKSEANSEELVCRAYQINHQPNQPGGESSLIQPTDWQTAAESDSAVKINTHFTLVANDRVNNSRTNRKDGFVKTHATIATNNSDQRFTPTEIVMGKIEYEPLNTERLTLSNPFAREVDSLMAIELKNQGEKTSSRWKNTSLEGVAWELQYDSIGKFNDLYCGYALVMNKSKFGFVDPEGKIFIPLIYDQLVVTTNIKSSKQKNKRQKKKVLYIPKRSGKDVKDCDEQVGKSSFEPVPRSEEVERKLK